MRKIWIKHDWHKKSHNTDLSYRLQLSFVTWTASHNIYKVKLHKPVLDPWEGLSSGPSQNDVCPTEPSLKLFLMSCTNIISSAGLSYLIKLSVSLLIRGILSFLAGTFKVPFQHHTFLLGWWGLFIIFFIFIIITVSVTFPILILAAIN